MEMAQTGSSFTPLGPGRRGSLRRPLSRLHPDVRAAVEEMKGRGVEFEEYDTCAWRIANFLSILEFAMHTSERSGLPIIVIIGAINSRDVAIVTGNSAAPVLAKDTQHLDAALKVARHRRTEAAAAHKTTAPAST